MKNVSLTVEKLQREIATNWSRIKHTHTPNPLKEKKVTLPRFL